MFANLTTHLPLAGTLEVDPGGPSRFTPAALLVYPAVPFEIGGATAGQASSGTCKKNGLNFLDYGLSLVRANAHGSGRPLPVDTS